MLILIWVHGNGLNNYHWNDMANNNFEIPQSVQKLSFNLVSAEFLNNKINIRRGQAFLGAPTIIRKRSIGTMGLAHPRSWATKEGVRRTYNQLWWFSYFMTMHPIRDIKFIFLKKIY